MTYTPPAGNVADFVLEVYVPPNGSAANFELGTVSVQQFFIGIGVSKRIGHAGDPDPLNINGIWQMRMTKRGKVPIKMKFYTPTNPQTDAQQANRAKFAAAMAAWQTLTDSEKAAYTERAKKRGWYGRNLFIREYYQSN